MTRHRSDCFLGIDSGTSGTRAILIDSRGNSLKDVQDRYTTKPSDESWDPNLWWHAVLRCMSELQATDSLSSLTAIAIAATSASVLITDANGSPLAPALLYNDQRGVIEAQTIRRYAPQDCAAHGPASGLAKALWLYKRFPNARWILQHHDWLVGQLTGAWGKSDENNSLKLGYDAVHRCWPDWIKSCGLNPLSLPEVFPHQTVLGRLSPIWAKRWGISQDVAIYAGTTDSIAAFIASGVRNIGEGVTSLGSTIAIKCISPTPIYAQTYGIYSHRIGNHWLAGGASNSGGAVLAAYFSENQIQALSRQIDPSLRAAFSYYPLVKPGERFPHNDPTWPANFSPKTADEAEFLHAMLQGMAEIEHQGYQLLQQLGAPKLAQVYTSGGGASNDTWTTIRQQILGVPVRKAKNTQAAYGAALLAKAGWTGRAVF